jgi:hypothetical protein
MNGVRPSRRRWLVLGAIAGVLVIMAVGAGIALAVSESQGTAGELNYQRNASTMQGGTALATRKARCPTTRHVTGGGFEVSSGTQVIKSTPYDGGDAGTVPDDGWMAVFGRLSGEDSVVVWAVCDD